MEVPSVGTTDERLTESLPIKFWSAVHLQRPFSWGDVWYACTGFRSKFRIEFYVYCGYYYQLELGLKGEEESELLNATELEFERVLMLPCVQRFLKSVRGASTCTHLTGQLNSDEGGCEYIQTELNKRIFHTLNPLVNLFLAWSSIALLFHLRRKPKEIGGLPLLATMRKVLKIFECYTQQVSYLWCRRVLGVFSALICPAF